MMLPSDPRNWHDPLENTRERNQAIFDAHESGQTYRELAPTFGITPQRCNQIARRQQALRLRRAEAAERASQAITPLQLWSRLGPVVRWMLYGGGADAFANFGRVAEDGNWIDDWAREAATL